MPRAIWDRPKRGFTLPLDRWIQGPLRERVRAVVCEAKPAGLQVDAKRALWARFEPFDRRVLPLRVRTPPAHGRRDPARTATRVWALFVLDERCRRHLG